MELSGAEEVVVDLRCLPLEMEKHILPLITITFFLYTVFWLKLGCLLLFFVESLHSLFTNLHFSLLTTYLLFNHNFLLLLLFFWLKISCIFNHIMLLQIIGKAKRVSISIKSGVKRIEYKLKQVWFDIKNGLGIDPW